VDERMTLLEAPSVTWSLEFLSALQDLDPVDSQRALAALERLARDPTHPSLHMEKLNGKAQEFKSIRASQSIRIILVQEGNAYFAVDVGQHDEVYRRAERRHFVLDPHRGVMRLIDIEDAGSGSPRQPKAWSMPVDETRCPLDHWTDRELKDAGFDDEQVARIRACQTDEDLLLAAIDDVLLELALELLGRTPETYFAPSMDPEAEATRRALEAIESFGALAGFSQLFTADELARLAAAPIEDWMIFLHPEQQAVVNRRFDGPARVRGAAGTGKTVVGLHRAAALATRFAEEEGGGRILFTTFISSLPPVFANLYQRLPSAAPNAVEFINIDKLATRLCAEAGQRANVSTRDRDAAYATAFKRVVVPGSPLGDAGFSRSYLQDEVTRVIKGLGLANVEDYLAIERTGRQTRFTDGMRRQAWDLRVEWDEEMAKRGTVDFADVILRARDIVREMPEPPYRSAIIDEAQDLTLVGLQLVSALVGGADGSDRLLIVGDGAQRVYAGGFTLRQAGLEVRGRSSVLRLNYRNTREILAAAQRVAGAERVVDFEETFDRSEGSADTTREGLRPFLVERQSRDEEADFVAERVKDLVERHGAVGLGDVAVFVASNSEVSWWTDALAARGLEAQELRQYDGVPTPAVKVGTYHRAKGLEFKLVFLPDLNASRFPRPQQAGQDDAEYRDARFLQISLVFVAMTRARDGLFLLTSGEPSPLLVEALDDLDQF